MDKKKQLKKILDKYPMIEADRDFIVGLIDNNNDAEDLINMPTKVAMAAFAIISPLLGIEGNNIISNSVLEYKANHTYQFKIANNLGVMKEFANS